MKRKKSPTKESIIESDAMSPPIAPKEGGDVSARLSAAQAAQAAGIAVMPLLPNDKKPAQKGWQKAAEASLEEAEAWARKANIGFRTGLTSGGLIVVDLDPGADLLVLGELPVTVKAYTGRTDPATGLRGVHLYFRTTAALANSTGKLGDHIDTRGEGGYVVAPGSIHPETGAMYEFAAGLGLGEVEIAELPQHLVDRLTSKSAAAATSSMDTSMSEWVEEIPLETKLEAGRAAIAEAEPAVSGDGGHPATFKVACALAIRCALPYESVLELMQEFNGKCTPPWSLPDLEHKCADAVKLFKDAPPKEIGTGFVSVARSVVEALGVSVVHDGKDLIISRGLETKRCPKGSGEKAKKRLLAELARLLPSAFPRVVLVAAAEAFMESPPVVVNEDDDSDVFAVSAKRLGATAPEIKAAAMELAVAPDLLERISAAYRAQGLVGLQDQALMHYLAGTSRILQQPICVLARGHSCSGKSMLGALTSKLMPSESVRIYSQITAKALLYLPPGSVKHRLICAGERVHEAKDSQGESTQILRQLLSEGKASQRTVDAGDAGRKGADLVVDGPISYIQSTTAEYVFDEDLSRMYQVWIAPTDSDRTAIVKRALLRAQGLEGADTEVAKVLELHHCFQRMLIPREVILPDSKGAAELLTVWPTSDIHSPRKVHSLIALVKVVALVHQLQRMVDPEGRLIANEQDVDLARGLMVRLNLMEDQAVFGGDRLEQLRKLWTKVAAKEFTAPGAAADLDCEVRKLRRWFEKWEASGFIRCARESAGSSAAVYQFAKKGYEALGLVDATVPVASPVGVAA